MILSYQGGESFKISQGDLSLSVNPKSKLSADITLFTKRGGEVSEKSGFVIDGPGEYEVKEVFIKGFMDKTFTVIFEGIKLCFINNETNIGNEELEGIDILFLPPSAYKSGVALEPHVLIPMDYDKASLAQFLKEGGGDKVDTIDKLVVKKKDLEGKKGEIIVLKEE